MKNIFTDEVSDSTFWEAAICLSMATALAAAVIVGCGYKKKYEETQTMLDAIKMESITTTVGYTYPPMTTTTTVKDHITINRIDIDVVPITYHTACPKVQNIPELTVSDTEYILLCNVVAHEYGADYVPIEEKAKVAAAVMNRVKSDIWPNDIYSVLNQENQFENFTPTFEMADNVSASVQAAVDLYLNNPNEFGDYTSFYGDGTYNYFY